MQLQKRLLKDILRQRRIAGEPGEEVEQLATVAIDQCGEGLAVACQMALYQIHVADRAVGFFTASHSA